MTFRSDYSEWLKILALTNSITYHFWGCHVHQPGIISQNGGGCDATTAWQSLGRNYICSGTCVPINPAFSSPLELERKEKGHHESQATKGSHFGSGTAKAEHKVRGLVLKPKMREKGKLRKKCIVGRGISCPVTQESGFHLVCWSVQAGLPSTVGQVLHCTRLCIHIADIAHLW